MNPNNAGDDQISVRFTYENTGKQTKFSANKDAKFSDVINQAYKELGEPRKTSDNFFCINGTPLDDYLEKDLHYVVENICKEANFKIRGKSGGAFFYFDGA